DFSRMLTEPAANGVLWTRVSGGVANDDYRVANGWRARHPNARGTNNHRGWTNVARRPDEPGLGFGLCNQHVAVDASWCFWTGLGSTHCLPSARAMDARIRGSYDSAHGKSGVQSATGRSIAWLKIFCRYSDLLSALSMFDLLPLCQP